MCFSSYRSSFCRSITQEVWQGYTSGQVAAFKAATYAIHLDDAPHVTFRYTYFPGPYPSDKDDPGFRRQYENMKITGMCPAGQEGSTSGCMGYEITYIADI